MDNSNRMSNIKDLLGDNYKLYPLKPLKKRVRQQLKKPEKRQPTVHLVVTEKGEKYKLLRANEGSKNLLRIHNNKALLNRVDFAPKILFSDEQTVLTEYIEGTFPDLAGRDFAEALGKNLAYIYNVDIRMIKAEVLLKDIKSEMDFLVSHNALNRNMAEKIWDIYVTFKPDEIRTSMVYADLNKPDNYVIIPEKRLFFIDIGSFQTERITGEFLLGGPLYENLKRDIFKKSYLNEGGYELIFVHEKFIMLTNLIRLSAFYLRKYFNIPSYLFVLKTWQLIYSKKLIKKMETLC